MTTIKEAIAKAKLGDFYQAANGKKAVFLRFTENSEYEFAYFYVDDWGWVQVFKDTGKEVNEDIEHSIVGLWQIEHSSTQKDVDLEKEIEQFLDETGAPYVWCNNDEQKEWCSIIARHFYELGLKAREK